MCAVNSLSLSLSLSLFLSLSLSLSTDPANLCTLSLPPSPLSPLTPPCRRQPMWSGQDDCNRVVGKIRLGQETLATIDGKWDGQMYCTDKRTNVSGNGRPMGLMGRDEARDGVENDRIG